MCDPLSIGIGALSIGGSYLNHRAQNKQKKVEQVANAQLQLATTQAAGVDRDLQYEIIKTRLQQENDLANQTLSDNGTNAARALNVLGINERRTVGTVNLNERRGILATDRAARVADAEARVSAGAAGVSGASVDALLTDITMQKSTAQVDIGRQAALDRRDIASQTGFDRDDITSQVAQAQRNIAANMANRAAQSQLEQRGADAQYQSRINGVQNLQTSPGANPWATAIQIGGNVLQTLQFNNSLKKRP